MKKALIITGGYINYQNINVSDYPFDLLIAADSGYVAAKKLKLATDVIIGDFDSASYPRTTAEVISVPAEKDDTDTMLACKLAIERGAINLTIIGGTGGRADHFLSNIFTLESFSDRGISIILTDGDNTIRVLNDQTFIIPNTDGYFSLFAIDTCEITLSGCKYPLKNFLLTRVNPSFAVSNEVIGDFATVSIKGKAILCECKK